LYFDSAYVAKCYVAENDAVAVRTVARQASGLFSSAWCIAEVACTFHRKVREGFLTGEQARIQRGFFLDDLHNEVWGLYPVTDRLLFQVETFTRNLTPEISLRAGDAIHLVSAMEHGSREIWTNDRHLLTAATLAGLRGHSVA
jgi:predicted nucleic acid-binding protein